MNKTVLPFVMLLFLAACSPTAVETPPAAREQDQKVHANPETTSGIQHMKTVLANADTRAAATNHQRLQTTLDSTFHAILQQCTMKGEDHEKLHQYLEPMPALIRQTGDEDSAISEEGRKKLKLHLKEYEHFFR